MPVTMAILSELCLPPKRVKLIPSTRIIPCTHICLIISSCLGSLPLSDCSGLLLSFIKHLLSNVALQSGVMPSTWVHSGFRW